MRFIRNDIDFLLISGTLNKNESGDINFGILKTGYAILPTNITFDPTAA